MKKPREEEWQYERKNNTQGARGYRNTGIIKLLTTVNKIV